MMELLVDVGVLVFVLTLLVGWLAVWRIGQVVSWRALAVTARATHSFADCVAFIRFCVEERDFERESRARRQPEDRASAGSRHVLEEWPRVS